MNRRPVSVMVIGVGNDLRADDAAGLEVARRLRDERGIAVNVHGGEAIDLLELWSGTDAVVLVDTMRTGEATGTIHRFDATSNPVPLPLRGCSSHAIGVAEAIELARTLGSLPQHVHRVRNRGRAVRLGKRAERRGGTDHRSARRRRPRGSSCAARSGSISSRFLARLSRRKASVGVMSHTELLCAS